MVKKIFTLGVLALLCAALLLAQQDTGAMTGTIVDSSGAAVPGAEVTVKNQNTAATFTAVTDGSGLWRAPQLTPGVYDLSVAAKGFSTLVRKDVEVRVADRIRVDLALQVGALTETVTITDTTPLVQVENASLGQVLDNKTIVELPLNGRNWLQLASLTPATVSGANGPVNIGGLQSNQQQYILDGADNTNLISAGAAFSPSVDALQEFKVQTNNFTAETPGFSGAVLNATVKSGSNSFHGNAYEFVRNNRMNARNFFALPTAAKPQYNRNQFGASIGGPFLKSKLFFFLNYDATRQRQANTTTTTVFTEAQKRGDFSPTLGARIGTDALGNSVNAGQIFDPSTLQILSNGTAVRSPFPGNVIPTDRIKQASRTLINLVPGPMLPTASNNFVRSISAPVDSDNFLGRVDWTHSAKDTVFGHLGYTDRWSNTDCLFSLPICGGSGNGSVADNRNRQATIGWTHIFGPTTINQFNTGYTRTVNATDLLGANTNYNGQYGIPLPFQGPHTGGLAYLGITGYTGLGAAASGGPYFQFVNKFELTDNLTVIRGAHSLKFGVSGRLKLFHNQYSMNYGHGAMTFSGAYTRQPGFAASGSSIADFLLGVASDANQGNIVHEKDIWKDIEWYAQDTWTVSPKLTVSAGVRYFFNPPSWEARDEVASVLTGLGYRNAQIIVPQGMPEATFNRMKNTLFSFMSVRRAPELTRSLVNSTKGDFAPRLGIAYQLSPKTVVRSGLRHLLWFPGAGRRQHSRRQPALEIGGQLHRRSDNPDDSHRPGAIWFRSVQSHADHPVVPIRARSVFAAGVDAHVQPQRPARVPSGLAAGTGLPGQSQQSRLRGYADQRRDSRLADRHILYNVPAHRFAAFGRRAVLRAAGQHQLQRRDGQRGEALFLGLQHLDQLHIFARPG
jgi:hypothetical protein